MKWVLDMDGVITSNPNFFKWWTYQLRKKSNNHEVFILTARNPSRATETEEELKYWGIGYDQIYTMPKDSPRDLESQALWKIKTINKIRPDVWVDNDLKIYKTQFDLDLDKLCPGVARIYI